MKILRTKEHKADLCIIGGGLAGVCTAISAARHGVSVVLMQDRPVLGGNASSEIRMCICGALGPNKRETGILEEIVLENFYRNTNYSYSIWDSVVYEKVKFEENITLLLNCTCIFADESDKKIKSVKGWQLTSETYHIVYADYFADCSGDSILAPLTSAEYMLGREARATFSESIQPEIADKKTMGMSCLIQIKETDKPQKFIPPEWAYKYESDDDLPYREHDLSTNFWWIELGGEDDSIHDTEELKDELLKIAFGVWDHMKNQSDHGMENWVLDWIGFLPGKRESRRYLGDYVLNQNDVESGGKFDDIIAYGGWSMDDHFPAGFNYKDGYPTIFHPAPSPYGIPYRCLYSKNIDNLFFAGRNISASHAALSSTRVMGTCSILGQALGTAASIAVKEKISPRQVSEERIDCLQNMLMDDDCYLPYKTRRISDLTAKAELTASKSNPEALRNGIDRIINDDDNGFWCDKGDFIKYSFEKSEKVDYVRLVFDSNLSRSCGHLPQKFHLSQENHQPPEILVKSFSVHILDENNCWQLVNQTSDNRKRFVKIPVNQSALAVKLTVLETWGAERVHLFSYDLI